MCKEYGQVNCCASLQNHLTLWALRATSADKAVRVRTCRLLAYISKTSGQLVIATTPSRHATVAQQDKEMHRLHLHLNAPAYVHADHLIVSK